jgi:phage/plasmid-like protein (TIGR03299 family)
MSVDVNDRFTSEKASQLSQRRAARDAAIAAENNKAAWLARQVADGRMVQLGPDRYRVTRGWDRGEVFTVTRTVAGIEVVAQHGLDLRSDGTVALYSAQPEWHELGQIIPGGTTDIDEVIRLGGLDFGVELAPATYPWHGETRRHEGQWHTVRNDTGAALGVVGDRYVPIQNREGFEFLQHLVANDSVVWESAGVVRGGRRTFVSVRLPQDIVVDATGIQDVVIPYVVVINSHDGNALQCVVTPWRPRCGNTERFAVRDAVSRWTVRHTAGAMRQIEEARKALGMSATYFQVWEAEENALARTDLAIDEFRQLIDKLWDTDPTSRRANRLISMFEQETQMLGRTAYAAERAITDYLDHERPRRAKGFGSLTAARATAVLEGSDDDVKGRAHRRLLLHANR